MNGSDYQIVCPKCAAVNKPRGKAMTVALTCQSCNIYFRVGKWQGATVEFVHQEHPHIPLRAKGRIEGFVYEVLGFVVKEEHKYKYRWREYLLFNHYRGYAFLSEYNGHWNFVWPIESGPAKASNTEFSFNELTYRMYQRYNAQVVYGKGEFFFDVFDITASTVNYEYISPPFMAALEQSEDSVLWCEGEYFSRLQIAQAFSISIDKLPRKKGIGYTQPFNSGFTDQALILFTILVCLVAFLVQIILNSTAKDEVVFHAVYDRSHLKDQKVIATPPFPLGEGTKGLEIYMEAPLYNDWFFNEFSLINEDDGTEYNFTKEIEYYAGYEDGTSWSEGSKYGEAYLSKIPSGRYHINMYPEFSPNNNSFSIIVKRDVPMWSNFYVTCIALLLFPAFYFVRKRYREHKRWSDSDYSPYATE